MKQQGELKRHSASKEQEHEERVLKGYVNGLRVTGGASGECVTRCPSLGAAVAAAAVPGSEQ